VHELSNLSWLEDSLVHRLLAAVEKNQEKAWDHCDIMGWK